MKKIVPSKVTLSRDDNVRAGKYVIGSWVKDYVAYSYHYRPSGERHKFYFVADLNNDSQVRAYTMRELRQEIIAACKGGVEVKEG